jgi:hypothetical protein
VREFTRSILPGRIAASGAWSVVIIFQRGLNILVVFKLTILINGAVAKLRGCGVILGKLPIKPCKGWCLSIRSKPLEVIREVIGYDEVIRFTIPSREFIIASFCF